MKLKRAMAIGLWSVLLVAIAYSWRGAAKPSRLSGPRPRPAESKPWRSEPTPAPVPLAPNRFLLSALPAGEKISIQWHTIGCFHSSDYALHYVAGSGSLEVQAIQNTTRMDFPDSDATVLAKAVFPFTIADAEAFDSALDELRSAALSEGCTTSNLLRLPNSEIIEDSTCRTLVPFESKFLNLTDCSAYPIGS